MSAMGHKRTSIATPAMSAIGEKTDVGADGSIVLCSFSGQLWPTNRDDFAWQLHRTVSSEDPDGQLFFPVPLLRFAVCSDFFPVQSSMETGDFCRLSQSVMGREYAKLELELAKFPVFSLLNRESASETGSLQTARTAIQSGVLAL
jgi:hypothetical protein